MGDAPIHGRTAVTDRHIHPTRVVRVLSARIITVVRII